MTEAHDRLHLRVRCLPDGGPVQDLWIDDGRWVPGPLQGARRLGPEGAFALPGLVDAHSHISYPNPLSAPAHTAAWMDAHRARYRDQGVLLLRDMGAASNHILHLPQTPDLPQVQAAGRVLLRHREPPMIPTEPDELVTVALAHVAEGAPWVKVFADWSDDFEGAIDIGFGGQDPLTYPQPVLEALCEAVHAAGARVAAHCFTVAGAQATVSAGVDSIEHGWGLDAALLAELGARGGAWCPMLGLVPEIRQVAQRKGDTQRLAWVEQSVDKLRLLLPTAQALGVTVLAGTDRGPGMHIAEEVAALVDFGLTGDQAVAAASWTARSWLGLRSLAQDDRADVVLYERDPRSEPAQLLAPALVICGGALEFPCQHS